MESTECPKCGEVSSITDWDGEIEKYVISCLNCQEIFVRDLREVRSDAQSVVE